MALTSDPHAWLQPFFVKLKMQSSFPLLAPSHQFEQLLQALTAHHPNEAAQMREWPPAAQHALMAHLAMMLEQAPPVAVSELWRVEKGQRLLRCVVQYLPSGLDLRLLEGDGFRRTQLCKDAPDANRLSAEWQAALKDGGWELKQ